MRASDVTETLDQPLAVRNFDQVKVKHCPRLLSDIRPAYLSSDLREYLGDRMPTPEALRITRRRRAKSKATTGR